jgi:hypothetical protein
MAPVKMITALATAVAIVTSLPNIGLAQEVRVTDDWMTLRPSDETFHVRIPPDWDKDSQQDSASDLSFRPRKPYGQVPFVNCKAGIGANPASAASTQESLDASVLSGPAPPAAIKELSAALGSDAVVRENGWLRVADHPAYLIVVSGFHNSAGGGIHAVASQVVLVRPGWLFTLACTVAGRTAEQAETAWITWRPVFLAIMGTFDSENH